MDAVSLVFALAFLYLFSYQLQLGGGGRDRKEAEETVPYLKRDLGDMTLAVAHLKLDPTYSVGVCGVPESEWKFTNPLMILTCTLPRDSASGISSRTSHHPVSEGEVTELQGVALNSREGGPWVNLCPAVVYSCLSEVPSLVDCGQSLEARDT